MQMQGSMKGVMVREHLRFFVLHLCMLVLFNKCMLSYSQSRGVDLNLKHVEQVLSVMSRDLFE